MGELSFYTLDVFTTEVFGGNQLAVFPDAPGLGDRVMQAIAREFSLSETVFVCPPEAAGALRRLRIFTPATELPFAGHPTIGTAQLLVELGIAPQTGGAEAAFGLEEGVGVVPVSVSKKEDGTFFTWFTAARLPERGPAAPAREALAELLGLEPEQVLAQEAYAPTAYSAGVPFTFVPLRDRQSLKRVRVDLGRWRDRLAHTWAPHLYVFCPGETGDGVDFHARMFAPALGISEDPATGAAAVAFGGYQWDRTRRSGSWAIEQGADFGRPSSIRVAVEGDEDGMRAVRVGGSAVRVSHGTMRLPQGSLT